MTTIVTGMSLDLNVKRLLTILTCTGASCEWSGLLQAFYLEGPFSMPGDCMWTCGGKAALGQVFIDVQGDKNCLCT
jgi:hypothetical protein